LRGGILLYNSGKFELAEPIEITALERKKPAERLSKNQLIYFNEKIRFSGGIITVSTFISDSTMTPEKIQFPIGYPSDLIDEE